MQNFNVYVKRNIALAVHANANVLLNEDTLQKLDEGIVSIKDVTLENLTIVEGGFTTEIPCDVFVLPYVRNGLKYFLIGLVDTDVWIPHVQLVKDGKDFFTQYIPVHGDNYYPEHGPLTNNVCVERGYNPELSRGDHLRSQWSNAPSNYFLNPEVFELMDNSVPFRQGEGLETNTILTIFGRNITREMEKGLYPDPNAVLTSQLNNSVQYFNLSEFSFKSVEAFTLGTDSDVFDAINLFIQQTNNGIALGSKAETVGFAEPELLETLYKRLQPHYDKHIFSLKDKVWK
jgi:hypothetical protein